MSHCEIFNAAVKLSPGERAAFLDRACGTNRELRDEVESLLQAHDAPDSFLREPVDRPATSESVAERPGSVIGPYKLLEQIGEGGFGVVFMAEQTQPVRRKVALKVLKPGMDSRQVVARFEAERQALAIMDHPNIARVFDGGATPTGRPYFVMELVRGVPITEFCDQNHLTPRQRLELFVGVCQAVQHAHQKGIIHRDLKPSNVLVTVHDTMPVVKVIDFGVAKALGQELTDKTLFTRFAQMIGTPLYMSPEQAGQSGLDVDTRSDIYALGVLLYELLTGTTPFTKERFQQAAYDEIRRIIREEEPPRPSTRLSESKDSLPSISMQRQTEPEKLTRLVRGELDWIVMKALEKDRNRRYDTANSFALDVQRYLSGELVQACPPSAGYRFRKFVGRNRGPVLAAGSVFVILVVLSAVAWVSNWQINHALDTRNQALGELKDEQQKTLEALARQTQLKNDADAALGQEKLALYSYRVSLAQREWYANRVGRADFLLDECPAPLRGWEWHYLKRLCHADLVTFRGHRGYVVTAEFSSDGKQVVSCGADGTIRVWDAVTGREFRSLKGHTEGVRWVTFSPDGRRLASGGGDQTVRLWDVATGEVVWTVRNQSALRLAFSPDGRQLAMSSTDYLSLKILDAVTGQEVRTIKAKLGRIRWIAYSRDGATLAWEEGRVVVIVNALTGQERRRLNTGPGGMLSCLALSPDGQYLATGDVDSPVGVWDVATGQQRLSLGLGVRDVAFSPDGRRIATAHADQTARVWDAGTGTEVLVLRGHTGALNTVAFDLDGRRLVTTSLDTTVKVWNAAAPQDVRLVPIAPQEGPPLNPIGSPRFRLLPSVNCLAVSSDGRRLALGLTRGTVQFFDVTDGTEMGTLDTSGSTTVAFSPDGRRLATGGNEDTVRIWDVAQRRQLLGLSGS